MDIMDIGLNLENCYQIIWGCFNTVKVHKRPWSAVKYDFCVMVIDHLFCKMYFFDSSTFRHLSLFTSMDWHVNQHFVLYFS